MALEYRNELKYVVSVQQLACLRSRIKPLMALDSHAAEKGDYTIRSVYFDDYKNTCYYENEDGTSPREKFRIRTYNGDPEKIFLELKRKERGKTHKDTCKLTREQCEAFFEGRVPADQEPDAPVLRNAPVLRKFQVKYETELYRPKVMVEYEREPYVYRDGNVRITFDTDIRSSNRVDQFFEERIYARPVMPLGYHLMEVKFDEFLPDHIYRSLQLDNLQQTAFSKYYLCRKYNMGGIKGNGF